MDYDKKTVVSVVIGLAAFGAIMYAISKIPSSVPGASIVKDVASAVK